MMRAVVIVLAGALSSQGVAHIAEKAFPDTVVQCGDDLRRVSRVKE